MTRFETTVAVAILAALAAVHGPAFGQYIRIGDGEGKVTTVPLEVNVGKAPKAPRPGRPPAPPAEPPRPVEPTLTVKGGFEPTRERAKESAIRAAVDQLHEYLMQQDPPVTRMPSTKFVRKLLLDQQEKIDLSDEPITTRDGRAEKMYRATVALRVEPQHIRELRSQERSAEALWVLAGLGGLAAVVAGFFRVDAWTKGYLTNWLVLGTVGAASLLAGLWWWAK